MFQISITKYLMNLNSSCPEIFIYFSFLLFQLISSLQCFCAVVTIVTDAKVTSVMSALQGSRSSITCFILVHVRCIDRTTAMLIKTLSVTCLP